MLWRPLPYPAANRLAIVTTLDFQGGDYGVRRQEIAAWLRGFRVVEAAAAYRAQDAVVAGAEQARFERVAYVSPGFFEVLGVAPSRGRADSAALSAGGVLAAAPLARRMPEAAAPGRVLKVGRRDHVVAGVMPPGVEFPPRVSAWAPLSTREPPERCDPQAHACLSAALDAWRLLVRPRPGVSLSDLRDDAARLQAEIRGRHGVRRPGSSPWTTPWPDRCGSLCKRCWRGVCWCWAWRGPALRRCSSIGASPAGGSSRCGGRSGRRRRGSGAPPSWRVCW